MGAAYDQEILVINGAIGYKFLKNNAGELRLGVFDLLNNNSSVNRIYNESYIEDNQTVMLRRFYMLTLIIHFKNFRHTPS